jgi:hypothetical protein
MVTFGKVLGAGKETNPEGVWGKSISRRGNSKPKGPEAGLCLPKEQCGCSQAGDRERGWTRFFGLNVKSTAFELTSRGFRTLQLH